MSKPVSTQKHRHSLILLFLGTFIWVLMKLSPIEESAGMKLMFSVASASRRLHTKDGRSEKNQVVSLDSFLNGIHLKIEDSWGLRIAQRRGHLPTRV